MSKKLHASYRGTVIKYTEDDYNNLKNLPMIEGIKLQGNLYLEQLGLHAAIGRYLDQHTLVEDVLNSYKTFISNQVNAMQGQIDTLVAAGGSMEHQTTLWTGTGNYKDQEITLSAAPDDFDEIIVFASGELHHYPVSLFCNYSEGIRVRKTTLHNQESYPKTPAPMAISEMNIKPKYNHSSSSTTAEQKKEFKIILNHVYTWDGDSAHAGFQATRISGAQSDLDEVNLYQIIGVKYNTDAETEDGRVAYDGETFDSIGDAIRYQAQHAVPADGSVTMSKFSEQVQQYMNYVSLRLDDHGGFIDTLWGAVNELDRRVTALEGGNNNN